MKNSEKKQNVWDLLYPSVNHLESYFKLDLKGIDDESQYFHPIFILDEHFSITTQCDISNKCLYAIRCNYKSKLGENEQVEIDISLFENIVIGYHINKEATMYVINIISKIRRHIGNLRDYCDEYVRHVLIGNSIEEISSAFISEIKTTTIVINNMKKNL